MLSAECRRELLNSWLPNISASGMERLIDLLEKGSPLLIHGSFTRVLPMGCLATHIAWNHPETAHLTMDAGICWLNHVAGLNPATSHVIREWDRVGENDYELRDELLALLKGYRNHEPVAEPVAAASTEELVQA
jgi:hypothetical protein